jgi:hypothetical protein
VQQNPTTAQGTLKLLRTVHGALMLSIVLYVVVMRMIPAPGAVPLSSRSLWLLGACAAASLAGGLVIRSRYLGPAFETLRAKPDDPTSLLRWGQGVLISDCLAEAAVLYGFVIHWLGGTDGEVVPFFIAGAAAMILWWPKMP